MKVLIIYHSEHHQNTEKIAKVMAIKSGADVIKAEDMNPNDVNRYDIIGFGSGVYNGKLHEDLLEIINKLPYQDNKKSIIVLLIFRNFKGANLSKLYIE